LILSGGIKNPEALEKNKDRAEQRMFSPLNATRQCDEKVRIFRRARAACKTFPLLLALFSFPATAETGVAIRVTAILPTPKKASSPYHTLTTQCPYPGSSNVNLIMASMHGSLEQRAINSLKNCLEPSNSQWTAEI
jgi:hypothetical protein